MSKIIDYAGLFPPAKLPMDDAVQDYLKYKEGSDDWMLSRFICPAARLNELGKYRDKFRSFGEPLSFSFLGRGGESIEEFLMELKEDLSLVMKFKEYHDGNVKADAYEVRFPAEIIEKHDAKLTTDFLNQIAEIVESNVPEEVMPFYEGAFFGEWEQTLDALIQGILEHNQSLENRQMSQYKPAGYKLRCGGLDATMYPTPEQVAYVIHLCKRYGIPLKATAGLHHPVRHFNQVEQVKMHGFLNVFGAGILAQHHDLSIEQIANIIEDENAQDFFFTASEFKWRNITATTKQIKRARSQRIISFGSCSFDEPREDLQTMGFLEG